MKIAVIVAMAKEKPFDEIGREIHPELMNFYKEFGLDTYFVYGRDQSQLQRRWRRRIEQIRWGKFHLLLRIYDKLSLSLYKFYVPRVARAENKIRVNVPEDLRHLSVKILMACKHLIDEDYDFIVRTTASSILNPKLLNEALFSIGDSKFLLFAGRKIQQQDGFSFVSGSFTIMNRKSVKLLFSRRSTLDYSLIDDVCFGKFFEKSGVSILPMLSADVASLDDYSKLEDFDKYIHFRCRTGVNNRDDLPVMRQVYSRIRSNT